MAIVNLQNVAKKALKKQKKKKNSDIQILRAAAIIAVLGFHLKPDSVPQGFLGVDIFFAISGYLMTVILSGKSLTLQSCLRFYERRLKRLLPAYILIIFATLAVTSVYLITTDYDFLRIDAIWSLGFATNFQSMFKKETYFLLISDYKFLLHTWSLSVEIQYYAVAPLILIPISWSSTPMIPLVVISGLSWMFQTFIPFPTISFGLVLSRIWQFLIGSMAFYALKKESQKLPEKMDLLMKECEDDSEDFRNPSPPFKLISYDVLRFANFGAIFIICFMPKLSNDQICESIIRLIATMLGGAAIYLGAQESLSYGSSCCSLFTKIGTYLGDMSYSVYLVHWPIIILSKYLIIFETTPLWKFLLIIFVISIVQYHFFEKLLLHQSSKITFVVCAIIYGFSIFILCQPQALDLNMQPFNVGTTKIYLANDQNVNVKPVQQQPYNVRDSKKFHRKQFRRKTIRRKITPPKINFPKKLDEKEILDPAAEANEKIALNCGQINVDCNWDPELTKITLKIIGFGSFLCSYDGTGNATVLVAGNSFAGQQFAGIKKAFNGRFKKMYLVTHPGCLVFESVTLEYNIFGCNKFFNKTIEFLEKLKPDILIVSQSAHNYGPFQHALDSTNAYIVDNVTKEIARYFQMFSTATQKIIFIEPHPTLPINAPLTIAKEISLGKNISLHNLSLNELQSLIDPHWLRIKAAMKECPICSALDMRDQFIENGKYSIFDSKTKLSFFCDNWHFSPHGVERMISTLKKSLAQTLDDLDM